MRRVVVTGIGMVTPLACGVKLSWEKLIAGQSGIRAITAFDVSDLASKVAGMVPKGQGDGLFSADDWVEPKDQRKMGEFIVYAMGAAIEAGTVADLRWYQRWPPCRRCRSAAPEAFRRGTDRCHCRIAPRGRGTRPW